MKSLRAALVAGVVCAAQVSVPARGAQEPHWVGTWFAASTARSEQGGTPQQSAPRADERLDLPPAVAAAAPGQPLPVGGQSPLHFHDQTLRQIAHISLGGTRFRVVLTNAFGTEPLTIGAAHVALRATGAAIVAGSGRALTFGGRRRTVLPAGAILTSDPVDLAAPDFTDLAVDIYLPDDTSTSKSPVTTHPASWQTNYVSVPGNHAGAVTFPVQTTTAYRRADGLPSATWFFLTRVEVAASPASGAIVALGDSITDGTASTIDTNNRWPDQFARRLAQSGIRASVLNAGIGGNRVLSEGNGPAALARFDRDVIAQPGVSAVIVLEGINDIGQARQNASPRAEELIAAHRQMIERAHARGLRIFGATLMPFEGANYWTPEGEAKRRALNEWIRSGNAYDAVFDFDAAVRDPEHPTRTLPRYDPGDHLHLNAAGYEAAARTIDVALFRPAASRPGPEWAGSWATAPAGVEGTPQRFNDETLRLIVHTTAGGDQVRVKVSNTFGTVPLLVGAAHIARRDREANIVADTDRTLTFGGRPSVAIPPGALALSDPVDLRVAAASDLAISLHLPEETAEVTTHVTALQTTYVARGDATASVRFDVARTLTRWPFLSGVDVAAAGAGAVVAFGDSITDGANSTAGANHRWPDLLAARLQQRADLRTLGVLNEGIIGNRILHPTEAQSGNLFGPAGLARFDRDVLAQAGVQFAIVLLGINDIGHPGANAPTSDEVSAEEIEAGYRQFIERAHARGIRIFGGTLMPFEDTTIPNFYSPAKEAKRQAVNRWIRASGAFDAVIDFDKAVRDPARPARMLPAYDSGDHLHPNDAGMAAMAGAIPLQLFKPRR